MAARIGDRVWQCDCCGMENDQRGCVKGPPQCPCYGKVHELNLLGTDFCVICDRCAFHCTGSPFYEDPSEHYLYRYLDDDQPIKKQTAPHPFVRFGLCNCGNVQEAELLDGIRLHDPRPGKVHIRCWRWKLERPFALRGGPESHES